MVSESGLNRAVWGTHIPGAAWEMGSWHLNEQEIATNLSRQYFLTATWNFY